MAFECIDGRDGNDRCREPVAKLNDSCVEGRRSAKAPIWIVKNAERADSQTWPHWRNKEEIGIKVQSQLRSGAVN